MRDQPSSPPEPGGFVEIDRNGLEVLDAQECARLLARTTFGRIGITVGALPTILPVNYRFVDDRVVFRTTAGTKLDAGTRGAVVAFEIDSIDPVEHSGWSVVVTGMVSEVTDPDELAQLDAAPIPRWAPSQDDHVVALSTDMVSGRRLAPGRQLPGGPWSHRSRPGRP